jgi:hypothetical protein
MTMSEQEQLLLDAVERKASDIASEPLVILRDRISPSDRRSSFRRDRQPVTRGRCLEFRCVSLAP